MNYVIKIIEAIEQNQIDEKIGVMIWLKKLRDLTLLINNLI